MGILLFVLGLLIGSICMYLYANKKINALTEQNLDKALVISLLKTRAEVSTKKTVNKIESKKTKATK